MAHQVAETDGPGLTEQPTDVASGSSGPTRVSRGVAIFAMVLAATGMVLHLVSDWEWAPLIAPVSVIILVLALPGKHSGDTRDRKVRLSGKHGLIVRVIGMATLVTLAVLAFGHLYGWWVATGETGMVIVFSLMTVSMAAPINFAPQPDAVSEGVEK